MAATIGVRVGPIRLYKPIGSRNPGLMTTLIVWPIMLLVWTIQLMWWLMKLTVIGMALLIGWIASHAHGRADTTAQEPAHRA